MKLAVDLHIHSCLSPCGSDEMTPNNIVNMAYLKGLQAIAVCDHNSAKNVAACKAVADKVGIILLPGMEIESREEVHVLCYFPSVEAAMEMDAYVCDNLPDVQNMPKFFGEQRILNEKDELVSVFPKLLVQATSLTFDEIVLKCIALGGAPVPAHINRPANAVIANLGFIPTHLDIRCVEVYSHLKAPSVNIDRYHVLFSSDAHNLDQILERKQFLDVKGFGAEHILSYLNSKKF